MRILFLTHYFPPEVNAPANRTHEHCREWVAAGHEVHVVTCIPSHPAGQPFPGYCRRWYRRESIDGIHVHRVWTYIAANRGILRRTVNFLSFAASGAWRAWRLGRFDVTIGTSPHLFCVVAAWLVARVRRMPWLFEVRDLWPDSLPAVGVVNERSMLLSWLQRLELRLYRDATAIACVSRSFVAVLAARGVDQAKLHFMPNGIIPELWSTGSREIARRDLGIAGDEMLVSYVGTVGMAHGLGTVVDAAAYLRYRAPQVRWLIAGDGAELNALRSAAMARGLDNVHFTGLVPRTRIPSLLSASDVLLVTLRRSDVFKSVLPSKMFEAMAAGRPIVLAVEGEARDTLLRAGAGLAVPPADVGALADAVCMLARDAGMRAAMGDAGAAFVRREFDRRAWAARYLELLDHVSTTAAVAAIARQTIVAR